MKDPVWRPVLVPESRIEDVERYLRELDEGGGSRVDKSIPEQATR